MATLHFKATTKATPEQFVAALTDFGPGRAELFENSTDDELEVHSRGPTEADVTEGSKGISERLHDRGRGDRGARRQRSGGGLNRPLR